jgi:hypothetical protein
MPVRIGDGFMSLEIDGKVVATATERPGGWWEVTYWPRFFDRNQAITALTVTELLERPRQQRPACPCAPRGAAMTDRQQHAALPATGLVLDLGGWRRFWEEVSV